MMQHSRWHLGRRRRALLAAGATVAAASLILAGCASTSDAPSAGGLGTADEPVEITLLSNDAYASQWQDQLVPEFQKEFPNIKVTIDGVPYNDQLAKNMLELSGTRPAYDVVMADDNWIPQMASTGGLVDLQGEVDEWTFEDYDWDDFYSAPLAAGEWDGVQYGVPARSNMLMMLYNKSHFDAAGLDYPDENTTWDEFMQMMPALVQDLDGDGATDAWGVGTYFVRDSLTPTIWQTIMDSNGGAILNEDGEPELGKKAVEALKIHASLLDFAPPGAKSWQFTEPLEGFRQGKIATMFNWGSVYRGSAVDPTTTTLTADQVGITTLPHGTETPGAHRGVWSLALNKKSENLEAAWTFVQWMTSKKGEAWQVENLGVFPARVSTLEADAPTDWLEPVYYALDVAWRAVEDGEMWRPRLVESDAVQQILADYTGEVIPGNMPADEAVNKMTKEITDLVG
ncbi:sugar ABC transporter substrate-binding protein [Salinibacterium sp. ZJ450]|uniref:ABC transporter substrate-binding protein n=1 Tax=Salinibacterium sp. ZJ450 TaxID=2708338 RepID=UPI001CD60EA5|nr:sugar ABC transporter substrate-binding protein [Salinibacterium sp. ZJ450]